MELYEHRVNIWFVSFRDQYANLDFVRSYLFIKGAIELSILAKHYQTEIAAFDVSTKKMYLYGKLFGSSLYRCC